MDIDKIAQARIDAQDEQIKDKDDYIKELETVNDLQREDLEEAHTEIRRLKEALMRQKLHGESQVA